MKKPGIILSADSTCDIVENIKEKYNIQYFPYHIIIEENSYLDGVDIQPEDIFNIYKEKKILPKTAAVSVNEYYDYFKKWTDQGHKVIHINLSSELSSSFNNCCLAAKELSGVFPIDSKNLSTGTGLLVLKAAEKIKENLPIEEILEYLENIKKHICCSFVLEDLEFLCAGGRCSSVAKFGANLLKIKPCIEMNSETGTMSVGKKYRGDFEKVIRQYFNEKFQTDQINKQHAFLTYTQMPQENLNLAFKILNDMNIFENIYIAKAGCTISSHCGPNTIAVMFIK